MYALLLTSVVLAQAPVPENQGAGATTPGAKPGTGTTQSLDGNWTVISYEKNGQPMAEAKDVTVTVKDNLVTFSPKDDKSKMMAIRLEFTQPGMLRATEVEHGGTAGTNDKPGGSTPGSGQAKQGVYVMTQDYLAICIHDAKGRQPGDKPGGTGGSTGDKPGGSGDQPNKEQSGTTGTSGTTGPQGGNQQASTGPDAKSYCAVILRKAGTTERK